MSCAGSLKLSEGVPNKDTQYSLDGSAMHEVAAACLVNGELASGFVGQMVTLPGCKEVKFTEEMAELVQGYVDHVNSVVYGGQLLVEQRVDFSPFVGVPEQFGTADVVILRSDELHVIDLKTGRTPVEVENNSQMLIYALGALNSFAGESAGPIASLPSSAESGSIPVACSNDEEDLT